MKRIALAVGVVAAFALAVAIISSASFRGSFETPASSLVTDPQASPSLPGKELCTTPGLSIRRLVSTDPHDAQTRFWGADGIKSRNRPLLTLAIEVYNEYTCRMEFVVPLPAGRYDVVLAGAKDLESAQALLTRALREAFNISVQTDQREVDVLVLTRAESASASGIPQGLSRSASNAQPGVNTVYNTEKFTAQGMRELADWIEHYMEDKPVLNETGLEGAFDFQLPNRLRFEPGSFPAEVAKLGLRLTPARRRIPIIVFAPASALSPTSPATSPTTP